MKKEPNKDKDVVIFDKPTSEPMSIDEVKMRVALDKLDKSFKDANRKYSFLRNIK